MLFAQIDHKVHVLKRSWVDIILSSEGTSNTASSSEEYPTPYSLIKQSSDQNRKRLPNVSRTAERFSLSDRAVAPLEMHFWKTLIAFERPQ